MDGPKSIKFGTYSFGHVTVILHNCAKNRPNMDVAALGTDRISG